MTGVPLRDVHDRIATADAGGPRASGSTLSSPAPWFLQWATGANGIDPGPVVNEWTAMNYAALYSCVSLIAGTVASLPLKVYKRRPGPDGGQDEAPERPEYDLLQTEFNPNTSAMTGRETGVGHLLTWGNSYCQVVRNKLGRVMRLQPLGPDCVCPETNKRGELEYEVYDRGGNLLATLPREEVLHVPGLSFDAMCGYSVTRLAKNVIRTGLAMDREAERFVTRGIRPPGAIKMPAGKRFADEKQAMKYRDSFRRLHASDDGSLNIMILEDGYEWQQLGIDPESAQLLEGRKYTALEVCGIYHVPPFMVGLVEKTTSWGTGIEELTIGFVVYCLLPTLRRIEQEYDRKLFRGEADRPYFCEHVLTGLLRGDTIKQAQALRTYLELGVLSVNEARRLLGHNPTPGGNVRYFPLTSGRVDAVTGDDIPAPAPAEPAALPPGPPSDGGAAKLVDAVRRGVVEAVARCVRKEAAEARKAAKRPAEFLAWLDDFYARHAAMVADAVRWAGGAWPAAGAYPARHVERSRADLLEAAGVSAAELPDAVERAVERWGSERLADLAAEFHAGGPTNAV